MDGGGGDGSDLEFFRECSAMDCAGCSRYVFAFDWIGACLVSIGKKQTGRVCDDLVLAWDNDLHAKQYSHSGRDSKYYCFIRRSGFGGDHLSDCVRSAAIDHAWVKYEFLAFVYLVYWLD